MFLKKVLRKTGEKIFVNLSESDSLPYTNPHLGYNKWPFIVLTPARTLNEDKDKDKEKDSDTEVSVYDAVVNPQVIALGVKDAAAKDAVSFFLLFVLLLWVVSCIEIFIAIVTIIIC